MRASQGRVVEIYSAIGGTQARIACPARAIPAPGQYLQATSQDDILSTALFFAEPAQGGFISAPPIPDRWAPGTPLSLWGPLGNGFRLPANLQRLGLIAVGDPFARLAPLAEPALLQGTAVTLFTDHPSGPLSAALEVYPLSEYPALAAWPDFLAIDLTAADLPLLRPILGLPADGRPPCPGQVLLHTSMPCSGLADCGVCAVELRRGWKLACKDGPVFNLRDMLA
jgi:dihydroorotate dehydrogenase electron transfer subunit